MAAVEEPLVAKLYLWEHECWLEQGIGMLSFEETSVRLLHVTSGTPLLMFEVEPDPLCFLLPHMFTESAWVLTVTDQTRQLPSPVRVALIFQTTQESQRFRVLFDRAKKTKRSTQGPWARNVQQS